MTSPSAETTGVSAGLAVWLGKEALVSHSSFHRRNRTNDRQDQTLIVGLQPIYIPTQSVVYQRITDCCFLPAEPTARPPAGWCVNPSLTTPPRLFVITGLSPLVRPTLLVAVKNPRLQQEGGLTAAAESPGVSAAW